MRRLQLKEMVGCNKEPETHGFVVTDTITPLPSQGSLPNAVSIPPSSEIRSLSPFLQTHVPSQTWPSSF